MARWYDPQPDRPAWQTFLLGAVIAAALNVAGVSLLLVMLACFAGGFVLGCYDHSDEGGR